MQTVLTLEAPGVARRVERVELGPHDAAAAERAGRWAQGLDAVAFRDVVSLLDAPDGMTHATFHAADGYAASIPLDQAMSDGVVLVPREAGRTGVRLVVSEGSTSCLNVKAVERIELTRGPGKHTVDPDPHENAFVPGWDES